MNELALLHITDSAYCFPISENSIVIRLRTAKNDITDAWVLYESKYKIGEQHNKAVMHKMLRGKLYDYYSVTLTLEDTRLAYVFYLNDGKRYCYFSEDGITESYDFTKGYYNFFQYPFINKSDILPKTDWLSKAVFYQIFVDRFYKGNNEKDSSYINMDYKIENCTDGDAEYIIDRLVEYNLSQVPAKQEVLFDMLDKKITDDNGKIIAGCVARMYCWNVVYIDTLWVDEIYRNIGFGSRLLAEVEKIAKNKGCYLIHLDTFDFQAKEFYEKTRL